MWAAICRGLGITSDTKAALELRPPVQTPSRIAWTPETLALIDKGNVEHGAFVALSCTACHGERGMSGSELYPNLGGMEAVTIFKQLDDFRAGKRSSGVMNAIATVLTPQNSADVAAYFASRSDGMPAPHGDSPQSGHTFREHDVAVRLIFAGDPLRGAASLHVLPRSERHQTWCAAPDGPTAGVHRTTARRLRTRLAAQ